MTVERPIDIAHAWIVNATGEPVDIYVNHHDKPAITNINPLSIGPEFQVKGKDDTPYGVYTFSARPKDRPNAAVLAACSIDFSEGRSFDAFLRYLPDREQRFAVYENNFDPSDAPRMTVRHCARPHAIDWRIFPKQFKLEIPNDEREGSLTTAQWQMATNVVQNDYRFEAYVEGELVAEHPDLELEHEKDRSVYIVGDPYATSVVGTLRRHIIVQEFQLPRGAPPPAEVTPPAEPYSVGDLNVPISFTCEPVELLQTNPASTVVSATDPDGVVTDLAITAIAPPVGGIAIPNHGVTPAPAIGGVATAVVDVSRDVPPGLYAVTITSNTKSLGQRATCELAVTVHPVTIARVRSLVEGYLQSGAIEPSVAAELSGFLDQAEQHFAAGDEQLGCEDLKHALALVGSSKDKGIDVVAAEQLDLELKALRANLGCG